MNNFVKFQNQCMLLIIALIILIPSIVFSVDEIDQINKAIAEKHTNWKAKENWVTHLSREDQQKLCGTILTSWEPVTGKLLTLPKVATLPAKFDWRDNNGNWVTPVRNQVVDQASCGSCWDFSIVAQVEAWWQIHNNNPDSMIDLSEQFILSCSNTGSCEGGTLNDMAWALEFIKTTGMPTEACIPWLADDQIPCSDACENWQQEAVKIPGWGFVTLDKAVVENIKYAVYQHPVTATYLVFSDFLSYTEGVYEHVTGDMLGGHGIVIVGWDDTEQSWICKNSWGADWGEHGFFRIKWGECEIGTYSLFIWDDMTGNAALTIEPEHLDLSLTVGDSASHDISITNTGNELLSFSGLEYEIHITSNFHSDSFNAWDGLSWWCGDSAIGGYDNAWLQYLDTPVINLSTATAPKLSLMGFWMTEDTSLVQPPFDGWDGCNVWISVDGGENFQVISPVSPEYNRKSLYGFGNPYTWNMGSGIAGWGGHNRQWLPITFDLAGFTSDSVVIRFAFASDNGYCVRDDSLLTGFFVDDIVVSDGIDILFENHGEDSPEMKKTGFKKGVTDWLNITNGAGILNPSESVVAEMNISTKKLTPGDYRGLIYFSTNDTTMPAAQFTVDMMLMAPEYDVAIEGVRLPNDTIPLFVPIKPAVNILNCGQYDGAEFDVSCTFGDDEHVLYQDTIHVPVLLAGKTTQVEFKPFVPVDIATLDFVVSVQNFANDYNSYNNYIQTSACVTNLVDNFEKESNFWHYDEGWIREKGTAHAGSHLVSSAQNPLMDCCLTFRPGFDLSSIPNAVLLQFYTRYSLEQDKDMCYIEASNDSLHWTRLDSLTGLCWPAWSSHETSLNKFTGVENEHVWVRFHLITDSVITYNGVRIDDISITNVTGVEVNKQKQPDRFVLSQNYPNPFNPVTVISWQLPVSSHVELSIYNILGQKLATLVNKKQTAGSYEVEWDASGFASGVYLYQLKAGNFVQTKKLILIR